MKNITILAIVLFAGLIFSGCSADSNQQEKEENVIFGKIELSDGWARPGSEGNTSGAYLTIANGTSEADTLQSLDSPAAGKTELHETYSENSDATGMRPTGEQAITASNELVLTPGGQHIMLMNLKRELAVGDSVTINLEFARVGTQTITVPVQIQQ
jgi:copper(I)-binding protein